MTLFGIPLRGAAIAAALLVFQMLLLTAVSADADEPPSAASAPAASASAPAARFSSLAAWEHAGYNSDEIVYTIFIESDDDRILRCRTRMQGYFVNAGKKVRIEDQQLSTVFPRQRVQAGIWMDMDEPSGATYEVRCRPG